MRSGFESIEVKLVGAISQPYETAVASARTCYSGKGIIYPEEVSANEKAVQLRDKIAEQTLEAGHLTTRQHAHFVFALSGVSRQFIWSFLHSHPFYNSEQVSQRYVKVKPDNYLIPELPAAAESIYRDTVALQMTSYEKLIEALLPPLRKDYYERFPARRKYADKWEPSIRKRAYEVARYVLGVGTTAYLYHTISALTLLRYWRLTNLFETPLEQKFVIAKMLEAVKRIDPLFEKEIIDPIPLEKTLEFSFFSTEKVRPSSSFSKEFDTSLDGRISKLVAHTPGADSVLGASLRTMLGKTGKELPDRLAVEKLIDPKENLALADTLNSITLDHISQTLRHVHFTFMKKLSHTADSQDQRHRLIPASRPILTFHYTGEPDFITPYGITQSEQATEIYEGTMKESFLAINRILDLGVTSENAYYLLPNAFPIRMISSGDLQSYHHKWKLRSCYNAQEEIFRATIDEIEQVTEVAPEIGQHLRAPCYLRLRAGRTPYCPEGDRFCGLPVWKYSISDYKRKSL